MSITFAGVTIPGTFAAAKPDPWMRKKQYNGTFSVNGNTELAGGRGRRVLLVPGWLHGSFTTVAAYRNFLDGVLEPLVDEHGALVDELGLPYDDCSFEGYDQELVQGGFPKNDPTLQHFSSGVLIFTQLGPG